MGDIPTYGIDGWWNEPHHVDHQNGRAHMPAGAWDTYTGRPLPPWPPAHVRGESFMCCLACPQKRPRCPDCPARAWEREGNPSSSFRTSDRREPLLRRILRRSKVT